MDLLEAFPTEQACVQYLINIRHNGKMDCPYCDHLKMLQNFLIKNLLLNFMEEKKKVAKTTKKDLQKNQRSALANIKVESKNNFKNTLDAFLKVNISEIK